MPEDKPIVKIGRHQLRNPTPSKLVFWVAVTNAVAGAAIGWLSTVNFIGHNTKEIISGLLGLIVLLTTVITPFVGMEGVPRIVDSQDVSVMDEPKK